MSIVAPEQQTVAPPQTVALPLPVGVRPWIVANRRLLVRRFASLAFNLSTGGLPYWELFLFTDRSLIDPNNASRRNPSNFYTSRQDGGLRAAGMNGEASFLVPSVVLRGFTAAVPKPAAIYYTVAAYATPDGSSPALPATPQQLAIDAPFVAISPDFAVDTVDQVLGVRSNRLRVVAQALADAPAPVVPTPAPVPAADSPTVVQGPEVVSTPTPPSTPEPQMSADEDRAAGEDGCGYYAAHPEILSGEQNGHNGQNGHDEQIRAPLVAAARPPAPVDDAPYDDGYGEYDNGWNAQEQSWAGAQAAPFPIGFTEPAALVDEEEAGWSDELQGVDRNFAYRGLDEPDAQGGNGVAAPVTEPEAPTAPALTLARPLAPTIEEKLTIIEKVAGAESGTERYGAINADGEFKGRFGPDHPAYHHHHIGVSYGIIQFTQESGNLGRLLLMMRDRNEQAFGQIFGENAAELLQVTTAQGTASSESTDGRSARTQPVGGADLWEEPWIGRFREAGAVTEFQAAQNELAATAFVDPVLRFAGDLGLDTDRALTMVVDRAVQMGVNGARHWIIAAVGPISTPALRQQACAALGFGDLAAFQRAADLEPDNLWGPVTHAALVGALRSLGSGSPVAIPTVDQMLDAMVRRADGDSAFWAGRVKRLRTSAGFTDQAYAR
jgi:hypothetical protein